MTAFLLRRSGFVPAAWVCPSFCLGPQCRSALLQTISLTYMGLTTEIRLVFGFLWTSADRFYRQLHLFLQPAAWPTESPFRMIMYQTSSFQPHTFPNGIKDKGQLHQPMAQHKSSRQHMTESCMVHWEATNRCTSKVLDHKSVTCTYQQSTTSTHSTPGWHSSVHSGLYSATGTAPHHLWK